MLKEKQAIIDKQKYEIEQLMEQLNIKDQEIVELKDQVQYLEDGGGVDSEEYKQLEAKLS